MFTPENLKSSYGTFKNAKLALRIKARSWVSLAKKANALKPLDEKEIAQVKSAFGKLWSKGFVYRSNLSQVVPVELINRAIGQVLSPVVTRDGSDVNLCYFA
jgi:hypothetical protein